jgi:hypothetical protein
MRRPNLLLKVAGVVVGSIGTALCLALIILAWVASNRLAQATDRLFSTAGRAVVAVRERVVQTRERIAASTEAAADIERSLAEWTRQKVSQRQASNLAAKIERLLWALRQADSWLEVAESSVGLVQEAVANSTLESPLARTAGFDGLIEELTSLRAQLTEATEAIDRIRDRVTTQSSEPLEARIEQGLPLARRVAATLGSMDSRFGMVEDRLTATHNQVQDVAARVRWRILVATIGVTLFLLWMALGQAALCWLGCTGPSRWQT